MTGQDENLTFWMRDERTDDFLVFSNPSRIVSVSADAVALRQALDDAEPSAYFAGAVSYDACGVLDPSLNAARSQPVLVGGMFSSVERIPARRLLARSGGPLWPVQHMRLARSRRDIYRCIDAIRESIRSGKVYQVNFTFPVTFEYEGDPAALFAALYSCQPASFASALFYRKGDERLALLSLSPELFFRVKEGRIYCRPMKGTAPRSSREDENRKAVERLRSSEKERAENGMIVDLIRNDLGQICDFGSVQVENLFQIQALPTVFQMTTDVTGRLKDLPVSQIFASLFPCGSVTGAPKRAAIELIHALEEKGRGFYTGAMGWTNGSDSCWNVAIRTVELRNSRGSLSVGSGITYDSSPQAEFRECLDKLQFFRKAVALPSDFYLYETMLFRRRNGRLWMLEEHLKRLQQSARYFGLPCSLTRIRKRLYRLEVLLRRCKQPVRVHLRLSRNGRHQIMLHRLHDLNRKRTITLEVQHAPALTMLPFLNHKTSIGRALYNRYRPQKADECVFVNEKGEVTETAIYTLFCYVDGRWVTPPLQSGVLAGLMRERLLNREGFRKQRIQVTGITPEDLQRATAIVLANSVRGLRRARLL